MNKTVYPKKDFNKAERDVLVWQMCETLEKLVTLSHLITCVHIARRGGSWPIQEQLCHAHSEISEVYEAIRQGNSYQHIGEELIDTILSSVTSYNVFMNTMWRGDDVDFTKAVVKKTVEKVIDRLVLGNKLPYWKPQIYESGVKPND